jgi:hypothetical protein
MRPKKKLHVLFIDFRRGVNEIVGPVGYNAAYTGIQLLTFRQTISVHLLFHS